jgi:cGMP-dependent protein kinase 1
MVQYYFACLMVSIEFLHSNSIVYRDLKPENSVIDYKGKVYLIDLGTAKELTADKFFKTFTIIGTPHYMAPEVFEGNGYSFEADLWSLGCLLYEFLCYGLPFGESASGDPYAVYTAIKRHNVTFPKFMKDEQAKNLINALLIKNPKLRSATTFEMIRGHGFFKNFDWNALLN